MILAKSVKVRLTLSYALILMIILSIFSFFMYSEFSRVLYRDTDRGLFIEARGLEESLQSQLKGISTGPSLSKAVQAWERANRRVSRSLLLIRLFSFDHVVLLSNLKGWEREILFPDFERDAIFMETGESFQTIHFQKKPIRLYYHLVTSEGRPILIIQCAIPIHELKRTLDRLAFIILFSIPGAVFAACIAGWILAKRSFRPVDHMIREAKQITAAYLKGRLPRTHARDELDRLAETLNEMMDRIESSTRVIQEFSSDVSHELKTPLAIIRGEIDLALRRSRSPEALVETLKVIEGEVNELIRLVDDLLLLVKSDAQQLRLEKKGVFLRPILEQVCNLFRERAQAKKIILSFPGSKDCQIQGDPVYLKRLFNNLVDNAIKFTPEEGQVNLSLDVSPQAAVIKVKDTGVGIEPELQEKVFSRFYRTDQARSQEGSGLGLNIAKAICEAHHGTLGIQSQVNRGTTVTVELPLT